jgi:ureidoacrylate peracid hydrolase
METRRALLLTLDFINEVVSSESKFGSCAAHATEQKVMEKANKAIAWARKKGILVAHVKVGFTGNYIDCPKNSPVFSKAPEKGILKLGTWGTEFHKDMDIHPEDVVIVKHRVSAFYATDLEPLLRANQIDTIYLSGVATNMAVELTAREAHDRDYQVVIIKDACGSWNEESHNISLGILSRIATVITTAELPN